MRPDECFFGSLAVACGANKDHVAIAIESGKTEGEIEASTTNGEVFAEIIDQLKDHLDPMETRCADVVRRFPDIYSLNGATNLPGSLSYVVIMHLKSMGCDTSLLETTHYRSFPPRMFRSTGT